MFESGSQIGKYVLGRKLGQGGYGLVFAAHDSGLDREVALKFLRPEHTATPEIARRFLHEARSAAKIAHPGIVTVYECGQLDGNGVAYIAMELLDGESLTDRLARCGRLSAGAVAEIGRQVASALDAAHRAGIVHRDLKPDNIFLIRDPAARTGERIKVLDFGIAKLGHASSTLRTQSMEVFGTPRYMSPEQCNSATSVDHRSDIYTLGCILFELACGRPPFDGQVGELIAHHVLVPAPSVLSIVPETPAGLAELIARMLAKEPEARPQTMAVVAEALDTAVGLEPTLPPDPSDVTDTLPHERIDTTLSAAAGVSMMHQRRRNTALYAILGAIAVLVPLALWLRYHDGGDDDRPPAKAAAIATDAKPIAAKHGAEVTANVANAPRGPAPASDAKVTAANVADASAVNASATKIAPPRVADTDAAKPSAKVADARPAKTDDPRLGVLSIASKPPCDIAIDGSALGVHTPQRELRLAAGHHKVTLVNAELGVKDTFTVDIKPGAAARVVRDYSAQAKDSTINPFAKGEP